MIQRIVRVDSLNLHDVFVVPEWDHSAAHCQVLSTRVMDNGYIAVSVLFVASQQQSECRYLLEYPPDRQVILIKE